MTTSPTHHASATGTRSRPRAASRRAGYVVAVGVNALLLYLLNRSPGWQSVPFLTDAMNRVIGVVNLSITAGLVANLVYLVLGPDLAQGPRRPGHDLRGRAGDAADLAGLAVRLPGRVAVEPARARGRSGWAWWVGPSASSSRPCATCARSVSARPEPRPAWARRGVSVSPSSPVVQRPWTSSTRRA